MPDATPLAHALRWILAGRKTKPAWAGEGGRYTDRKSDRGGRTRWGCTGRTIAAAVTHGTVPRGTTPKSLTRDQAARIYAVHYWAPARCSEMPPAIGLAVFDACVNSGQWNAVRWLQRALGCRADGRIGPKTLGLANGCDEVAVLIRMRDSRMRFLRELIDEDSTQAANRSGWKNRLDALDAECADLIAGGSV